MARKKNSKAQGKWLWLKVIGLVMVIVAAVGILVAAAVVQVVEAGLPEVPSFQEYRERVPKISRVFASNGSVIAEFFVERRTVLDPKDCPENVKKAILAAEDAKFYQHAGLSYLGIARAMLVNMWRGKISQGGSTITQQVVKQVLLSSERTYERKFRELLLARLLEKKLTKDEILSIYLSHIYMGHGQYGFVEASNFYFAKPVSSLNLAEAALLAGIVAGPEGYSPIRRQEKAAQRQHYVLGQLAATGLASEQEVEEARNTPVKIYGGSPPTLGVAPYFTDAVRREVLRLYGSGSLLNDGLTVYTTLDLEVSDAVQKAVDQGIVDLYTSKRTRDGDEIAAKQKAGGRTKVDDDEEPEIPPPPQTVLAKPVACLADGKIEVKVSGRKAFLNRASLRRLALAKGEDLDSFCPKQDLWVSLSSETVQEDGSKVLTVNAEIGPQVAAVVLNAKDKSVLALVGGEDFTSRPFNRAVMSKRPIGSTVKPFLYAAALENGVNASDTFVNDRICFRGAKGRSWCPRNYSGGYDGRTYGIGEALAKSTNVIAVKVLGQIGAGRLVDLLSTLGIPGAPKDLSLALGSVEASPLALTNAMSIFGARGKFDTPHMIDTVIDSSGRVLLRHEPRPSQPISWKTAASLRTFLRQVVTEGSAKELADLPYDIWGKTGTSNKAREAWFVGGEKEIVASFLVGYDDRMSMKGATGGNTAVPFFKLFMEYFKGLK